jgi:hypothetical protein
MARTIYERNVNGVPEYVWLDQNRVNGISINSGHYTWYIDLEKGECSLNSLPLNIDTQRAYEIINALQEIIPMLKPNPDDK